MGNCSRSISENIEPINKKGKLDNYRIYIYMFFFVWQLTNHYSLLFN